MEPQSSFDYNIERKKMDIYLHPKGDKHSETIVFLHGLGDTADGWLDYFLYPDCSPIISPEVRA